MLIATGSYVGNATNARNIDTGLGVNLRAVIIKSAAAVGAQLYTSSMATTGAAAQVVTGGTGNTVSFPSAGLFQVSNSANLNGNGTTFYWAALSDADGKGDFTWGVYVGNGLASNISCTLNPVLVLVKGENSSPIQWRSTAHSTTNSSNFTGANNARVTALGTGQYSVAGNSSINAAGVNFHWLAFSAEAKVAVGTYAGNSTNAHDISSGLMQAVAAFIQGDNAADTTNMRTNLFADNSSAIVNAAPASNGIERFKAGGVLELGTDASVNATGTNYYWFAFGNLMIASDDYRRRRTA